MKSKINYHKHFLFVLIFIAFSFICYLIYILSINRIELIGDLNYIDTDEVRIYALNNIKNQNLILNSGNELKQHLINSNPEIEKVEIAIKDYQTITIKISNKKICCTISDSNKNKFLIDFDGKAIKKLSNKSIYPGEIELNQYVEINYSFMISSLQKLRDIENILLSKNFEFIDTTLDGKNITFKSKNQKELVLDNEVSTKVFVEKLDAILLYLKKNNKDFQKIDFRFGKVIVK